MSLNPKSTVPAIGEGNWLVGANDVAIAYRPIGNNFTFSFSLHPSVGYFFTDGGLVVINNTSHQLRGLGLDLGFQFFFGGSKE